MATCDENVSFEDNVLKVKYVPITRNFDNYSNGTERESPNSSQIQEDDVDYYAHECKRVNM